MLPEKVEERTENNGQSTFGLVLARRETPVVLKGAARSWPGTEFLEVYSYCVVLYSCGVTTFLPAVSCCRT